MQFRSAASHIIRRGLTTLVLHAVPVHTPPKCARLFLHYFLLLSHFNSYYFKICSCIQTHSYTETYMHMQSHCINYFT